jgi:hypothetical protein
MKQQEHYGGHLSRTALRGLFIMRCYFHLTDGHERIVDDKGMEVRNLDDAHRQAMLAVNEFCAEADATSDEWGGWTLEVTDEQGEALFSISLADHVRQTRRFT